ncbi:hypothetical protein AZI86_09685 [Bdellovibrio bacteriovorus]|uniref:Uncharacterized protein n=1 Tax=Bdellovibrio bacteriovorus TaxID=959 RepID=A0A150WST1_BDEBC|nr:DUF1513 domain-containing protein [Bdellovibrio bacteriovorus]KYG67265.1 hypothetical protein AZI86_09685 [Bdellovibrio bacteriovorus]
MLSDMLGFSSKQFLGGIIFLAVVGFVYYGPYSKSKKLNPAYLVGEYKTPKTKGKATLVADNGHIIRRWPVPFSVHTFSHNNALPWQLAAVENLGDSMAIIDARIKNTVEAIKAPEGLVFSGHGIFSTQGDRLFIAAQDKKTAEGFLLIYDTETNALAKQVKTEGLNPHDLQYDLTNSKNLILINAGSEQEKGQLLWLSEEDGKIVKSISFSEGLTVKHFSQSEKLIYLYGPSSFAMFNRKDEAIKIADWPSKNPQYAGEILNAYQDVMNEKIWLTVPTKDLIVVLEQKTLAIAKTFAATKPASILASPLENPELLMISVGTYGGEGMQKAYNLKNVSGSDAALDDPRKFYAEHATPLEVAIQE